MLSNPISLEILIKEHQKDIVEEAKMIRLKIVAKKNNKRKPFFAIDPVVFLKSSSKIILSNDYIPHCQVYIIS